MMRNIANMLLNRDERIGTTELLKMIWDFIAQHLDECDFILDRKHRRLRSFVRDIGSRMPMQPCRRAYFALISTVVSDEEHLRRLRLQNPKFINDDPVVGSACPTLADLDWVIDETQFNIGIYTRLSLSSYDSNSLDFTDPLTPPSALCRTPSDHVLFQSLSLTPVLSSTSIFSPVATSRVDTPRVVDTEAMLKISALEDELAKLRAQIATIVSAPPVEPGPVTTASPTVHPGAPPCAPPPPPPPPPPMLVSTPVNVIDMIKMNRKKTGSKSAAKQSEGEIPDMKSVLRGLSSVKLRQIARSPGGTPLHSKQKPVNPRDPAAIIAQALKQKFARTLNDSPVKFGGSPRSPTNSPSEWDKENYTPPVRDVSPGQD